MKIIVQSALKTLKKSEYLLDRLTNEQLCNNSVSPYYSSIGTHIRHILDFYECIFNGNVKNRIDLIARPRNKDVELKCDCAKDYLKSIINKLNTLDFKADKPIVVVDDLSLGIVEIPYTFAALLAQANSHTIHHYAIINYILDALNISIEDSDFGYNPTTPKPSLLN